MLSDKTAEIKLQGLIQGYGKRLVINGLDLAVGAGVTALLGPNGAGKTTLLRTLVTEIAPRRGTIEIAQNSVATRAGRRAARRQIGFLPQNFVGDPLFTVTDLVRYAAWLREADTSAESITEALTAVDLTSEANKRIRALSGGMKQRAAIAATIVGNPPILVFDEPTVGLDPEQRVYFRRVLDAHRHRTVILSTHLIEDVVASADRVVVMADGELRFDGLPQELAAQGDDAAQRNDTAQEHLSPAERGYLAVIQSPQA